MSNLYEVGDFGKTKPRGGEVVENPAWNTRGMTVGGFEEVYVEGILIVIIFGDNRLLTGSVGSGCVNFGGFITVEVKKIFNFAKVHEYNLDQEEYERR